MIRIPFPPVSRHCLLNLSDHLVIDVEPDLVQERRIRKRWEHRQDFSADGSPDLNVSSHLLPLNSLNLFYVPLMPLPVTVWILPWVREDNGRPVR